MPRRRMTQGAAPVVAQAWIELVRDDPEAGSALAVARAHLPAGRPLVSLRRLRLFEISGALPARAAIEGLLHRSIQFYNPQKERCTVRARATERPPLGDEEHAVLVFERGGERRAAAERWWRHETGEAIEVSEGVVWALGFAPSVKYTGARFAELAVLRDPRHGLFCNPHAQEHRIAAGAIPMPWMAATA